MIPPFLAALEPPLIALLIFIAALLAGRMLLARMRDAFSTTLAYCCAALSLGLGIAGLLMLALGALFAFNLTAAAAVVSLLAFGGLAQAPAALKDLRRYSRRIAGLPPRPVTLLVFAAFAAYAFLIFLCAYAPVVGFDAAEYHLGGVREFIKVGRIHAIPGNFYTALPFQIEMLFGLGLLLEGGAPGGSPKMINFLLLLAANAALYALMGHVVKARLARVAACLLFSVHPLVFKICIAAKSDMGLTLFVILALLSWAEWLREGKRVHLILLGAFLGFAVNCKYTAIGMFLIPAVLALVPFGVQRLRQGNEAVSLAAAWEAMRAKASILALCRAEAVVLLMAGLAFLPWVIKNVAFYGNPLYPLLPGLFPNETFSVHQYEFYCQHHGAAAPLSLEFWRSALERLTHYRALFWLPLLAAPFVRRAALPAAALLLWAALGHLACNVLTGNPDRFQAPLLPAMLLVIAVLISTLHERPRWGQWVAPLFFFAALWEMRIFLDLALLPTPAEDGAYDVHQLRALWFTAAQLTVLGVYCFLLYRKRASARWVPALLIAPFLLWFIANLNLRVRATIDDGLPQYAVQCFTGKADRFEFYARRCGQAPADAYRFVESEKMRRDATVLLLYDAQWYYFPQRVVGNTVFDRGALCRSIDESGAQTGQELYDRLRGKGIDYLFVNEFELLRTIRDIAPDRALTSAFPRYRPARELRDTLRQPGAASELLKHDELYPPYLFESGFPRKRKIIHEFLDIARQRQIFESNPAPRPRIWSAEIN